jgi:hypothetical protein
LETFTASTLLILKKWSARQDSNLRPYPPQGYALPSCATGRKNIDKRLAQKILFRFYIIESSISFGRDVECDLDRGVFVIPKVNIYNQTNRATPGLRQTPRFSGGFAAALPMTRRILSIRELLKAAILTRLGVSAIRIYLNYPRASNQKTGESRQKQFSAFFERVFIEIFGVGVQTASLYITTDLVGKLLEGSRFLLPPVVRGLKNLSAPERKAMKDVIDKDYASGIIKKQLFDPEDLVVTVNKLRKIVGVAKPKTLESLNKILMGYHHRLWITSAITLATGIISSAYFSGALTQSLNDNIVSEKMIPWLIRKLGLSDNRQDASRQASAYYPVQPTLPAPYAQQYRGM